ncbi:MAG: hypothetical protein JWO86_1321 [Myxococcaceae bacterium]|jgi:hypothetical protein|nr:hypothetical protein [Myxococcaceae bacterium]MEA2751466.1 hypothetical protein [Myxococcales bacterium]
MGTVEALDAALAQHLAAIQHAAISSPPGGGGAWDPLLRHYGHAAFDPQERAMIVSCMHLTRGAVPAELRVVLIGLQGWAQRELDRLRSTGLPHGSPNVDALQHRIAMLVDSEVSAYERALGVVPSPPAHAAAVAPAGPSLASIFANAQQTSKEVPWAGKTYKSVVNLNCVHCGGPQEQPQDFMCKYCRRPIAGSIKPTA